LVKLDRSVHILLPVLQTNILHIKGKSVRAIIVPHIRGVIQRIDLEFSSKLFESMVNPIVVVFKDAFNHKIIIYEEPV